MQKLSCPEIYINLGTDDTKAPVDMKYEIKFTHTVNWKRIPHREVLGLVQNEAKVKKGGWV